MTDSHNHQAAGSRHAKALEALRARLAAADLSEGQLLAWLKDREAVPDGIFALRSIPRAQARNPPRAVV